jgi:hypothetical protein
MQPIFPDATESVRVHDLRLTISVGPDESSASITDGTESLEDEFKIALFEDSEKSVGALHAVSADVSAATETLMIEESESAAKFCVVIFHPPNDSRLLAQGEEADLQIRERRNLVLR